MVNLKHSKVNTAHLAGVLPVVAGGGVGGGGVLSCPLVVPALGVIPSGSPAMPRNRGEQGKTGPKPAEARNRPATFRTGPKNPYI